MSVLREIVEKKRERLATAKQTVPVARIRRLAHEARSGQPAHRFVDVLKSDDVNIIAEFKRRSPSKGMIKVGADPESVARSYEAGGAVAMSVLTEEDFFSGSLEDLRRVKSVVQLPVLRKDFVFDEYQIYESAACGAEAVLLIAASLDDGLLSQLRQLAENELGLDALVEVHEEREMERAVATGARLIGVNNRNLHTFEVSLNTSLGMAATAPADTTLISESGLHNANDLSMLRAVGYHGFLIGESLMRSENATQALQELRGAGPGR